MTWRFDYRRWDGTQDSLVDDTDSVLSQLTDDLLANGDLHEALQRMLNRGWQTPDGEQVQGLRDLLDQLRLEREEQLDRGDLGGAFREVAEELQRVLAEERTGIEQLQADARGLGRPAPHGGHRRGGRRAADAAGPAAERPGRHGARPAGLRVRLLRGPPALRGADGAPARGGGQDLLRPDVRGPVQSGSRTAGAHARGLRRAQPDDRAAGGRRADRPVVRVVHGAVRGPVPRQPRRPRRTARAVGGAHGRGAGHVELDVPRAEEPAPGPGRVAARGHRPALAGGPAGRQPPAGLPRGRVGPAVPVPRRRAHGHGGGDRRRRSPAGPRRAGELPALGHLAGRHCRRSTSTRCGGIWATTPPGPWTAWPG